VTVIESRQDWEPKIEIEVDMSQQLTSGLFNGGFTMPKSMTVALIVLITTDTLAGSGPYKGPGGQIEAYGMIMGTYFAALAAIEICGEDRAYERESEETARNYLNTNHALYVRLARKLNELAKRMGEIKSA
jgi:hypothetical protein